MDSEDKDMRELRERVIFAIKYQIRPAEEVEAVRRLMGQNLATSLGTQQLSNPLSLVDADAVVTPSDDLSPSQREFVEAVKKNVELRAEFSKLLEENEEATASIPPPDDPDDAEVLELQMEVNDLQHQIERLLIFNKFMDDLERQPAAHPDFLNPDVMFKDCSPMPEMPRELTDSFTFDKDASNTKLQELVQRIQKENLRQKLLAKREREKYEEKWGKNPIDPSTLHPEVQLHALNAVKDYLINWIETMLSKAGDGDAESSTETPRKPQQSANKVDLDAKLAEIQREYDRHIELRKEIMSLLAEMKKFDISSLPDIKEKEEEPVKEEPQPEKTTPETFLLTPYLEQLQALSREQKGLVQEKSHINATLAKHQQETSQILSHLMEESQLLQKFPASKSHRPEQSFSEATKAAKQPNVTSQIEPWLLAADAAKLATLETVAEKVEEGQMAIDDAMGALDQASELLNKDIGAPQEDNEGRQASESDDKSTEKKAGKDEKCIWSKLDGNLGLINE